MYEGRCSFFGHRKIEITDQLTQELKVIIEDLIINKKVRTFLFGSKSEFDNLCHLVVTELKQKYQDLRRISYTCKSESCVLESERERLEKLYSSVQRKEIKLLGFEEEFEHKNKYTSGRASYVERNQAMINDSDYCVFYYDKNYLPKIRKSVKQSVSYYQPKSGTAIAYAYANQKNKIIINLKQ